MIRRFSLSMAAIAGLGALGATAVGEASANTRLQLAGRVPPRASVWMSQTASLLQLAASSRPGMRKLLLTELDISANNKQFSVSLVSRNAANLGAPGLVDPASGDFLPYRLTLDGTEMPFDQGTALVKSQVDGNGPKRLELEMPEGAEAAAGAYEERLLVVITAR